MISGGMRSKGFVKIERIDKPLISVITVVRNGARSIERTINSVLDQSYANIEYIIIDGGSIDGTIDIIDRYSKYIDYWQSDTDAGIYDAMNRGLLLSSGSWTNFKNADDWYVNQSITRVVDIMINNEVDIIGCSSILLDKNNERKLIINNHDFRNYPQNILFDHRSLFFRIEYHKKYLYNSEKYRYAADRDVLYRMLKGNARYYITHDIISGGYTGGSSYSYGSCYEELLISQEYNKCSRNMAVFYKKVAKKVRNNLINNLLRILLPHKIYISIANILSENKARFIITT